MANQLATDYKVVAVNTPADKECFTKVWYSIWKEEGYAVVTDNIIEKYAKYDPYSTDFLLMNNRNYGIGTMRIINQNGKVGLPVFNDFTIEKSLNEGVKVCEATLLTVQKEERQANNLATFLLLIELWRHARVNNFDGIVIAADIRLWYFLTHKLGLCFREIGQPKIYEGSMTVPGYLSIVAQKELSMRTQPKNMLDQALMEI